MYLFTDLLFDTFLIFVLAYLECMYTQLVLHVAIRVKQLYEDFTDSKH